MSILCNVHLTYARPLLYKHAGGLQHRDLRGVL